MKNLFAVKLQSSGYFIAHRGFSPSIKGAILFTSPLQAVKAAEKRSGIIDEQIELVTKTVKA